MGLGTQTALNAGGLESVAEGCLLLAPLASGSPGQAYVKVQGVTLTGTTCHGAPGPPVSSAASGDACRMCGGLWVRGQLQPWLEGATPPALL